MKNNLFLLLFLIGILSTFPSFSIGQNLSSEKAFFENNKEIGGDIIITNMDYSTDEKYSYVIFDIEVPATTTY